MTEHIRWEDKSRLTPKGPLSAVADKSEAQARLEMHEVINLGSRSHARLVVQHKGCPFCGSDPLPAALVCGRYVVACEAEDCQADVQATGATPEAAWKIWDGRI